MKKSIKDAKDSILRLLNEEDNGQLPRRIVEQSLSTLHEIEDVKEAITVLLNDFTIDLAVDYPSDDSGLNTGRPRWFLRTLSDDEKQNLCELSPLKLSLLNILRRTTDEDFPGRLPIKDVNTQLIADGYSTDEIRWLSIVGRVYRVKRASDQGLIPCYMIIPEYEKTEAYRKFQEESSTRATEKEIRDMKL